MPHRLNTLKAWIQAKQVARDAYRLSMDKPLCQHFRLADQIRGAANSVPANIIEGYALGTRPQLVRCLRIAFASACELSWHLEMARDMDLVQPDKAAKLETDNETLIKLLVGLIKKLSAGG
jgi:four helix bundle protein